MLRRYERVSFSLSAIVIVMFLIGTLSIGPFSVTPAPNTYSTEDMLDPFSNVTTMSGNIENPATAPEHLAADVLQNETAIVNGSSGFIGGEMVYRQKKVHHTQLDIVVWAQAIDAIQESLNQSKYRISHAESSADFLERLEQCSVTVIHGPVGKTMHQEEKAQVMEDVMDWISRGNLLILDNVSFLTDSVRESLGISRVYPINETIASQPYHIRFMPTTSLVFNLPQSALVSNTPPYGFILANSSGSKSAAELSEVYDNSCISVAVLGSVGNGYCLSLGFDLGSIAHRASILRGILHNAIGIYASVEMTVRTSPIYVDDAVSPHLYPLKEDHPLMRRIDCIAESFCEAGFNVYYDNLLSADYRGGFYGSVRLRGPIASFVRLFRSSITVISRCGAPFFEFTAQPQIPGFASDLFTEVVLDSRNELCWPTGWAPPQLDYFHVAPNIEAVDDMGADSWVPGSVEDVLDADTARSQFGYTGTGTDVAIIDTGFSWNPPLYETPYGYHPFYEEYYSSLLQSRYTPYETGGDDPDTDESGHGTGITANLLAVAPDINLHFISWEDTVEAFDIVLTIQPDVVSCSWGMISGVPTGPSELQCRIRQATQNGIIVVFAGGNEGGGPAWPGSEPCVVSAGGAYVDENGNLQAASYASSGSVDAFGGRLVPDFCGIVGQGTGGTPKEKGILIEMPTEPQSSVDCILSGPGPEGDETEWYDGWCVFSGTSSATPQIAGLAALAKQIEPSMTGSKFKHLVMSTCTDVRTGRSADGDLAKDGFDRATGAGLINVYRTIETLVEHNSLNIYAKRTLPEGYTVNFYPISTGYGAGYHIDTIGPQREYRFDFMGYLASRSQPVMVNQEGFFVTGHFRQYDTLPQGDWPGRRMLNLYVLSVDGLRILKTVKMLDWDDGTSWKFVSKEITLPSDMWGMVRIAFGRRDAWSTDWKLTAEWGGVYIDSFNWWVEETLPSDKYVNSYLLPPFELGFRTGHHVDTCDDPNHQYGYRFYARPLDYTPHLIAVGEIDVSISGWFRQYDTLPQADWENRRYIEAYVMDSDDEVIKTQRIVEYYDGTDWVYRHVHFKLPWGWYFGYYHIVIGRWDWWYSDWNLTVELCSVQITVGITY